MKYVLNFPKLTALKNWLIANEKVVRERIAMEDWVRRDGGYVESSHEILDHREEGCGIRFDDKGNLLDSCQSSACVLGWAALSGLFDDTLKSAYTFEHFAWKTFAPNVDSSALDYRGFSEGPDDNNLTLFMNSEFLPSPDVIGVEQTVQRVFMYLFNVNQSGDFDDVISRLEQVIEMEGK